MMWHKIILLCIFVLHKAIIITAGPCLSSPCQNGATCEVASYSSSDYQCILNCPSYCYGLNCDVCIPTTAVCGSCPGGFTEAIPGFCFILSPGGTFTAGDSYCQSQSAKSATVNDANEEYALRRYLTSISYPWAWVGYGDPTNTGTVHWVDGSNSIFNWGTTSGGRCMGFYSFTHSPSVTANWWSDGCSTNYRLMCRYTCATGICASSPCMNGAFCELASYSSSYFQCDLNCPSYCYGQQCHVCTSPACSLI